MTIFLDANIILDLIDQERNAVEKTKKIVAHFIQQNDVLYTSCDIFTTVYYVASKRREHFKLLTDLEKLLELVHVIPIDAPLIKKAIKITKDTTANDLEDVLQYVCAKSVSCNLIVTNDKKFYQGTLPLKSVQEILSSL